MSHDLTHNRGLFCIKNTSLQKYKYPILHQSHKKPRQIFNFLLNNFVAASPMLDKSRDEPAFD